MRWGLVASLAVFVLAVPSASAAPPQRFLLTLSRDIGGQQAPRLVLVDRSGALVRRIGDAGYVAVAGKWSPDGSTIAWSDPAGVHVENADGTNARLLVPFVPGCNTSCTQPSFIWTPDGTALDVGGVGQQTNELLYVPLDGAPPSPLEPTRSWSNPVPAEWTTGGRSFVWSNLAGDTGTSSCCRYSIFETTAATHKTRTLFTTLNWHGILAPVISPDGRERLMFDEATKPGEWKGYRLRVVDNTTGKSRLLGVTGAMSDVRWSPDGRTIAAVLSGARVVTVPSAGGRIRAIGRGLGVVWGRDGTLYVLRNTWTEVWTSWNGAPERFLFRAPGRLEVYGLDAD
ncbi:MAG TPA: hypothetical protein VGF72_10525 [Gaiellaceae bacterium]